MSLMHRTLIVQFIFYSMLKTSPHFFLRSATIKRSVMNHSKDIRILFAFPSNSMTIFFDFGPDM